MISGYDDFYAIALRVASVNIAFEKFAEYVQELLVQYLRSVSEDTAAWYKEWWTDARAR